MAERKPLVFLDNNLLGELPVGDHIAVNWGNISGIPANITAWAAIAPSSKADISAVAYAGFTSNQSNRITDFASLLSNGLSTVFSAASSAIGNPVGNATAGIHLQYQSGTSFDLAVTTTINPRLFVGSMSSGVWNEAWTSGNFNPALKADLSAVVTNGSNQTGIVGTKEWLNAQTFVGSVVSQHTTGTGLVIERTNSALNSSIEYRGTGGSIWAGLRNATTWSINDVANLSTTPWFDSTPTAAYVNGNEIIHYGLDTGWINITFSAGWSSSTNAAYRRFGNFVKLRGTANVSTPTVGTIFATLPAGYRPAQDSYFSCQGTGGGYTQTIIIEAATGRMVVTSTSASGINGQMQLDHISFYTN